MWKAQFINDAVRDVTTSGTDIALMQAVLNGNAASRDMLFDAGVRPTHPLFGHLVYTLVDAGERDAAMLLVEHGADAKTRDSRALRVASHNDDYDLVLFLVDMGADASVRDACVYWRARRNKISWDIIDEVAECAQYYVCYPRRIKMFLDDK